MATYTFGALRLDAQASMLFRDGRSTMLGQRTGALLRTLVERAGEPVSKDALIEAAWPGLAVEDSNLTVQMAALRRAIEEAGGEAGWIETLPRRGYRYVGPAVGRVESSGAGDHETESAVSGPHDRPAIAVMPFDNLSDDPAQDYFTDGMVEDIINGLSRIKWLSVIARNSSFFYKGKPFDIRQVGKELGVRYALQGSVRKSGDRLRISAYLVDTLSGRQLWTERYDRSLGDVFQVQDEIAMSVVGVIEPGLRAIEFERVKRKRPDSLDAYDLVLRALPSIYKLMPDACAPAIPLLEKALRLEPDYPFAHAALAWCFHIRFSRAGQHEADRAVAIRHARAAVAGAGDDATTLAIAAFVIWFDEHDLATAFDLFDRALATSPSNLVALSASAFSLAWTGTSELAVDRARRALALSPFDPLSHLAHQGLAATHFHLGRYAEAYEAARRAVEAIPTFSVPYAHLAAALVRLGRREEAKAAARSLLRLDPTFTIRRFLVVVGVNPDVFGDFVDAWHEAGLPDH
jgi:TolB-like protein/tetratricopeptide (TPR) repeat protein